MSRHPYDDKRLLPPWMVGRPQTRFEAMKLTGSKVVRPIILGASIAVEIGVNQSGIIDSANPNSAATSGDTAFKDASDEQQMLWRFDRPLISSILGTAYLVLDGAAAGDFSNVGEVSGLMEVRVREITNDDLDLDNVTWNNRGDLTLSDTFAIRNAHQIFADPDTSIPSLTLESEEPLNQMFLPTAGTGVFGLLMFISGTGTASGWNFTAKSWPTVKIIFRN